MEALGAIERQMGSHGVWENIEKNRAGAIKGGGEGRGREIVDMRSHEVKDDQDLGMKIEVVDRWNSSSNRVNRGRERES